MKKRDPQEEITREKEKDLHERKPITQGGHAKKECKFDGLVKSPSAALPFTPAPSDKKLTTLV